MVELEKKPLSATAADKIPEAYIEQAQLNLATLKRVWFESRGIRYHDTPESGKSEFLDQQINAVLEWSRVDLELDSRKAESNDVRADYAADFFAQIESWIAAAEPEKADLLSETVRDGIIRWLSTRSLTSEPLGTRQELATRIVAELDRGLRLEKVMESLPDSERQQLASNSLLLIEAWLHLLAADYEQLPPAERKAFMQARLDQVESWDLASLIRGGGSTTTGSNLQASIRMPALINGWIEQADEESRPRFREFMMDLQKEWLGRQMASG